MKLTPCTGNSGYSFNNAPRCGAKTRSGLPCNAPAIRNRMRCRMHGGKGSGAPKGSKNAIKHGLYTAESIKLRLEVTEILTSSKRLMKSLVK